VSVSGCVSVYASVLTFPFVHDSDHRFCSIFLRFGMNYYVIHVTTKTKFDGH